MIALQRDDPRLARVLTKAWLIVLVALVAATGTYTAGLVLAGKQAQGTVFLPAIPDASSGGPLKLEPQGLVRNGLIMLETVRVLGLNTSAEGLMTRVSVSFDSEARLARLTVTGFTGAQARGVANRLMTRLVQLWDFRFRNAQTFLQAVTGTQVQLAAELAKLRSQLAGPARNNPGGAAAITSAESFLLRAGAQEAATDSATAPPFVLRRAQVSRRIAGSTLLLAALAALLAGAFLTAACVWKGWGWNWG